MTEKIGLSAELDDQLFQAGLKRYMDGLDQMTAGGDDVSEAAKRQGIALTNLSKTLADPSSINVATTALDALEKQFLDGEISAEKYAKGTQAIQEGFGIITDESKATAGAFLKLEESFNSGEISAEEYASELKKLTKAEDSAGQSALEQAARIELVEKAYSQVEQLIRGGLELAELGANFDRQQMRFEAFAEGAGGAAANLEAFQRGAGGTVNKMEAMTAASRLLQMGIVGNADEMERVVEAATRLGDQTQSAGSRVNDFALMLANTSLPRLDAYGLSAGFVRERMAELQAATADMTREQAFAQAVFEASEQSLDVLGDRVEDNAAKMERAKAKIEDTRIEIGQKLAGAAGTAAGAVADLEGSTITLIAALTGAFGIVVKFSGGLGPLIKRLGTSGAKMGALGAMTIGLVVALERAQDQLAKLEQAQENADEAASTVATGLKELTSDSREWGAAIDEITASLVESKKKYEDNIVTGSGWGAVLGTDADLARVLGTAVDELNEGLQQGTGSYEEYTKEVGKANEQLEGSGQVIVAVNEKTFEQVQALEEAKRGWADLTEEQRINQAQVNFSIIANSLLSDAHKEEKAARDAAIQSVQQTEEQLKATNEAMAQQDVKLTNLQRSFEAGIIVTDAEEAAQKNLAFTIQESGEKLKEYNTRLTELRAEQEAATQAAQDHTVALIDQAEALSDADAADAASAAIDGLNQLLDEGAISLEEYQALVQSVQDDYGLVNQEGRALAEGIDELNAGLASGALSMEEYRTQLDALIGAQVGSLEATKAQIEAQKALDKEIEKSAKDAEREAERLQKEAERKQKQTEREAERAREKAEKEAERLAEKIRRDVEREMEAAAKAAEELPGKLFDALSGLGSTALKTLQDELEPLDDELETIDDALEQWKKALADPTADLEDQQNALAAIGKLEAERAAIAAERAEQEARIAEFQQAQQQMALLQQQLDLMKLVQENGLDAQEILGGLTADASASDIVEATTAAMQQIIEQTRAGLDFGGGASSATTMMQAPTFATPTIAGGDSTQNSFNFGGNNISGGIDLAQFESVIRRVLAESVNG